jgi:hypothetical protein
MRSQVVSTVRRASAYEGSEFRVERILNMDSLAQSGVMRTSSWERDGSRDGKLIYQWELN